MSLPARNTTNRARILSLVTALLIAQALGKRGHEVRKVRPFSINGCGTGVLIDPATGSRIAGAERRRDCYAVAY